MKTYDLKGLVISYSGVTIQGFSDGDAITLEPQSEIYTSQVGSDGEVVRSRTNDTRWLATVSLMQTSQLNDAFSALAQADKRTPGGLRGPFLLKDLLNGGTTIILDPNAYIQNWPSIAYGREAGSRDWQIMLPKPDIFIGGDLT